MKAILLAAFALLLSMSSYSQSSGNKELRHVVLFGWKDGTDSMSVKKVVEAFRALPGKIKLIRNFEWGVNNSPEKLNQGLTHCFFLTFRSEKDRDEYIVHPAHQQFVALDKPGLDKVTVLDYWVQK